MPGKLKINPKDKILIIYVLLAAVTLAVFWQVSQFEFVILDDVFYVTQNSYVQSKISFSGILWAFSTEPVRFIGFWHPLTWISLMLDYQLFGVNAGGYHMTNLILHILSALLLFWLFNRMTQAVWESAFVAAFFALHPLRVESVAWVAERKDVLSVFFWILTLCLYVYYTEKPAIKRYLLVCLSFICGFMSKPTVVTLPVIMILLDYWPLKRFESQKGNSMLWQLREKTVFFFLSAIFSFITIYAHLGLSTKNWQFPFESRVTNALMAFVIYLRKIFWPHDLAVCYPFFSHAHTWYAIASGFLIVAVSVAVILMIKKHPYLPVGWLWYAISILPVIGIIPVGNNAMADRYIYVPFIGIAIMLAWGIPALIKGDERRKKILYPATLVLLAMLTVLTWQQCRYWKNSTALFNRALLITKDNPVIHNGLASSLFIEGDVDDAMAHYNKAIELKPDYAEAYNNRAFVYLNRGNEKQGCLDARKACEMGNCRILDGARARGFCR